MLSSFFKARADQYPGEPNNGNLGTSIVTFETEVVNLENDIASGQNPNAFIKINDLGILLGKEFYTH